MTTRCLFDFWRARKSPYEVRAIEVELRQSGTCANPAVKRATWQVYQKLDWAALNRMLAVPRRIRSRQLASLVPSVQTGKRMRLSRS